MAIWPGAPPSEPAAAKTITTFPGNFSNFREAALHKEWLGSVGLALYSDPRRQGPNQKLFFEAHR